MSKMQCHLYSEAGRSPLTTKLHQYRNFPFYRPLTGLMDDVAACCFQLGNTVLVAISALDPVNVVRAFGVGESGIHLLHVNAAVRHLWMTSLARGARVFVVPVMTTEAAETLVDSHRGAIIA